MRNIIIVNLYSTGVNFIGDIIRRNYNPIVLEMIPEDTHAYDELKDEIK